MGLRRISNIFIIFMLLPLQQAFGGWVGPVEVVGGPWGSDAGQFGIEQQDSGDFLPRDFGVDKNGIIVIADKVNNRIQLFKPDGSVYKILNRPAEIKDVLWPWTLNVIPDGNSFLAELTIFDYTGAMLSKIDIKRTERYATANGYIIYNMDAKTYSLYSPTGQLIKTTAERPAELGVVTKTSLGSGRSRYVVQYPERTCSFETVNFLDKIIRDSNRYVYSIAKVDSGEEFWTYQVSKYSACGKEIGLLKLPPKHLSPKIVERQQYGIVERRRQVIDEYGEPVVAPNGDVYTWKRTPDAYSILKWTWQDDPNAPTGPDVPTNLAVAASINGLYLTWIASSQDPGCVTGYEISRATSAGGVGTTVGTVNAGTLKYNDASASSGTTYYYKVRAVSGSEYSPYTNEVSGRR